MNELTLGEKIRKFRMRSGLSQFQLEMEIDASPGTISRVENGLVNPTKETIIKIIEALDIRTYDAASLFNLDFEELPKMVKLAKKLSSSLDIDQVLQNAVNEITFELGLLAASIYIVDGEVIKSKTFTQTWFSKLVLEVIRVPFDSLSLSLVDDVNNLIVKSVNTKEPQLIYHFRDASFPAVSIKVSNLLERIINHKSSIVIPIMDDINVIGVIMFSKDYIDDFKNEYNILLAFSEHISAAIINARKYQELKIELNKIRNMGVRISV